MMIEQRKRIYLDRIQTHCESWWEKSCQFNMLHRCYEVIETEEGTIVSNLIKKSQIVLCVAIGLIATITIQVLNKPLD